MIIKETDLNSVFRNIGINFELTYENEKVNESYNYYILLENWEDEVIDDLNVTLESLLYSKYYWYTRFMLYHKSQYGQDAGLEQKQFKILEQLGQIIEGGIDFSIIKSIEEDEVS